MRVSPYQKKNAVPVESKVIARLSLILPWICVSLQLCLPGCNREPLRIRKSGVSVVRVGKKDFPTHYEPVLRLDFSCKENLFRYKREYPNLQFRAIIEGHNGGQVIPHDECLGKVFYQDVRVHRSKGSDDGKVIEAGDDEMIQYSALMYFSNLRHNSTSRNGPYDFDLRHEDYRLRCFVFIPRMGHPRGGLKSTEIIFHKKEVLEALEIYRHAQSRSEAQGP